jgi:hypothetical protein
VWLELNMMKRQVLLASAIAAAVGAATAAQAATNLVVNGDFSQGDTGFTSQYRYVDPTHGSMMPEQVETIASDPKAVHPYWVALHDDNPMLLVNGATHGSLTVWQESLATVSGQAYSFSAEAMDVCCNAGHPGRYAPSELEFEISSNDFATFQTLATIDTASKDAGQFMTATVSFVATGATQIRIVDALTGRVGNDFGVDDISVTALAGPDTPPTPPGPGVTAAAVPEPGSWSLMIAGLGGLGGMIRATRRRAKIAA